MCARARERYSGRPQQPLRRRRKRHAALPNLIIIGGLKCGTTSIHHYLGLHPEIQMSKPKELNFFVEELNWDLGLDWYASRFDSRFAVARRVLPPLHQPAPLPGGRRARIHEHCPDARLIYMVRDPIKRILSHWVHASGAGYETREMVEDPLRTRQLLHQPLQVLDAAAALPRALRSRSDRGDHPGGAARRTRGDDAQGFSLRRSRRGLHLRAVRSRVGEVGRQAGRQIPADGEADQAARLSAPSTATSTAFRSRCAGSSRRSSTTPRSRRPQSRSSPTTLLETLRGRFGSDVAALRSSPAASSPAGTTTADRSPYESG